MTVAKLLGYNLPLFADLTPADFDGVLIDISEHSLDTRQVLFDREDTTLDLYFLLSGTLLGVYWTSHGREIVYARFPVNGYFGELAALDGVPRSLAVIAKSPSKVLRLKRSGFLQIPAVVSATLEACAEGKIQSLDEILEFDGLARDAANRVISTLEDN